MSGTYGFDIRVTADLSTPQGRCRTVEGAAQIIAEEAGVDAAEGTMMLLVAAVHVAMRHSEKSAAALTDLLSDSLACAILSADEFFKAKPVQ